MRVAPVDLHLRRHARLRQALATAGLDALVVTSLPNVAYLTGLFASTATLVVTPGEVVLIVDGRYAGAGESRRAALGGALRITLVPTTGSAEESTVDELARLGGLRVGFEPDHVSVRHHHDLTARLALRDGALPLTPCPGIVEGLRAVKDEWELARLRDGGARLSDAAKCILPKALAGISERELAWQIEAELCRVGFEKPAFDTIVASGPNAALPHYRAGARRLERGDLVVLDFGGVLDGYAVDLSRTLAVGEAGARERGMIEAVADAQQAAFRAVKPGATGGVVDAAARDLLVRAGLGEAFCHGTGHGLGLEVHERPRIGRRRPGGPDETLVAGMVFTLEPGAYIPGWGGVRIEDDVVVTEGGAEWLTDVPRLL